MTNQWRTVEGFGRPVETERGVWSVIGADDDDHSIHCDFIYHEGMLPCSCDATRKQFSWWWRCWLRWQQCRVSARRMPGRVPWPVKGPDEDPWVRGVDFD